VQFTVVGFGELIPAHPPSLHSIRQGWFALQLIVVFEHAPNP